MIVGRNYRLGGGVVGGSGGKRCAGVTRCGRHRCRYAGGSSVARQSHLIVAIAIKVRLSIACFGV